MTLHPAVQHDFDVILEEYEAGKIDRERATRELLYIGVAESEVRAILDRDGA